MHKHLGLVWIEGEGWEVEKSWLKTKSRNQFSINSTLLSLPSPQSKQALSFARC